ncbi:hypothetical protein QM716_15650 [Rhodococcus sp. IEGM 1409]|uniref:hypothetical protein n=1 Tax=Rhodococcus sp. IEGM 1409 TaxID=3047082 RepID=UPI0024B80343|nr:hypothetical protein [Rhodococcus sp. IEGM 1409]MDI9901293.1 hypothetical protein [Rhodococcus sp. IEGM 1409]
MMIDGKLCVSAEEVAEFAAPTLTPDLGPIAPHLWLIELSTGATQVVRSADYDNLPDGWALLMTGPEPDWVAQWSGDWQRACDEQINPLLADASDEIGQVN